ncbi:MAG: hypothetical protein ACK5KN_16070 [Dysgonomonas sp.]|uniref:hypothetical protein n=1 Tax=Dysgonomonas sp. TaxID=1891233 RepID=UPI003A8BBD42
MGKIFLAFVTSFISLLIFSCDKEDSEPFEVHNEANKTWYRLNDWRGNDDVIVFPIITDLHSGGNDKYKQISYVIQTSSLFNFDFIANLGDLGIDEDKTNTLFKEVLARHEEYNKLTIFCKGNHEDVISDSEFSNYLQKPFLNKSASIINIYPNSAFGHCDIEDDKIRIFFLNTSDGSNSYRYNKTQLQYVIDNLLTIPNDDWCVVFLAHWCPNPIGRWNTLNGSKTNYKTFMKILESYVSKKKEVSDTSENINMSWDFSNVRGHLVGYLCGDSHFDNQIRENGVNYIITQGYGTISDSEKPQGAITTPFDYNKQMLVDVVAIKRLKREMKIFRLGAGGSQRDREFYF